MSAPRFYFDEDSSDHRLVRRLRAANIDVETAEDAGLLHAKDPAQVKHVLASQRILVTGDHRLRASFIQLTQRGQHHPGILFLPKNRRKEFSRIVYTLALIHAASSMEEMEDRVEFIPY